MTSNTDHNQITDSDLQQSKIQAVGLSEEIGSPDSGTGKLAT